MDRCVDIMPLATKTTITTACGRCANFADLCGGCAARSFADRNLTHREAVAFSKQAMLDVMVEKSDAALKGKRIAWTAGNGNEQLACHGEPANGSALVNMF